MASPKDQENAQGRGPVTDPNRLTPMVSPSLTPGLSFDPDREPIEIEYGSGKNWQPTFIFPRLPVLAHGEEILWNHMETEGVFNKKAKYIMALTNFRAFIYDFKSGGFGTIFLTLVDDILVMNTHRVSDSTRTGGFGSVGRYGVRGGTYGGVGTSRSHTVGDVVFMKDGNSFITFGSVSDPSGIARLAKSIKKQVHVRDRILAYESAELPDDFGKEPVAKDCAKCEKQNDLDARFCNMCGSVLE